MSGRLARDSGVSGRAYDTTDGHSAAYVYAVLIEVFPSLTRRSLRGEVREAGQCHYKLAIDMVDQRTDNVLGFLQCVVGSSFRGSVTFPRIFIPCHGVVFDHPEIGRVTENTLMQGCGCG